VIRSDCEVDTHGFGFQLTLPVSDLAPPDTSRT
jgi:hypothetical protein